MCANRPAKRINGTATRYHDAHEGAACFDAGSSPPIMMRGCSTRRKLPNVAGLTKDRYHYLGVFSRIPYYFWITEAINWA
jgi:hypothetical protein